MGWTSDHGLPHSALYDWDPEDRAKLHAYLLEESLRCTMCGTADWEWDEKQGGSKTAYDAENRLCTGCYRKHAASEDNDSLPGTTVILVQNTPERRDKLRLAHLRTMEEKRRQAEEDAADAEG